MAASFAFHGKLPTSVDIKYRSMGISKKKKCKLVYDHRPLVLQLGAFNDHSWQHLISDLGHAPESQVGPSGVACNWITTHICSVCYKFGHQSNDCPRLGANRQKRKDFFNSTSEQNMLVMAEHTPQIDKGLGLESYSDKRKADEVASAVSEVDLEPLAQAPEGTSTERWQ